MKKKTRESKEGEEKKDRCQMTGLKRVVALTLFFGGMG